MPDDVVSKEDCERCNRRLMEELERTRADLVGRIEELKQSTGQTASEVKALALEMVRLQEQVKNLDKRIADEWRAELARATAAVKASANGPDWSLWLNPRILIPIIMLLAALFGAGRLSSTADTSRVDQAVERLTEAMDKAGIPGSPRP
jgi:chorismate mutase